MMRVHSFTFNYFSENTYVLYDNSKECAIVDPGCYHAAEREALSRFIETEGLRPVLLLNTHGHIDHILGNEYVADKYGLPLHLHREEMKTIQEADDWALLFGIRMPGQPAEQVFIDEGDSLYFGNSRLEVLLTPGHSRASLSFYNRQDQVLLGGDVLMHGGIGRTDLPGGSFEILRQSIRNKFFTLPDDCRLYPGHGPATSIGTEKKLQAHLIAE